MRIVLPAQTINIDTPTGIEPIWFEKLKQITDAANQIATTGPLATTAKDGFSYLPAMAGAPTGVPVSHPGTVACVYDTTNHKLWIYDTATNTWRGVVLT